MRGLNQPIPGCIYRARRMRAAAGYVCVARGATQQLVLLFSQRAPRAAREGLLERPWYPQRAERAADCAAVPAARRIIFYKI